MSSQPESDSKVLLEILQRRSLTVLNENRCAPRSYRRVILPPGSLRTVWKDMPPSAPLSGERGPTPWPVPSTKVPREQNILKEIEQNDVENELEKRCLDFSGALSDNRYITAKVARAIFQKISELYPDNIEDVLREEQIPSLRIFMDGNDEDDTAEAKNEKFTRSNSSVLKVEGLFADNMQPGNVGAKAAKPEEENIEKRLSEQVDHGVSLRELFSDEEEINPQKHFIGEDAQAEEEILSFSLGGDESQGSNHLVKEALKTLERPSLATNGTPHGGIPPIPGGGFASSGAAQKDTETVDRDLEAFPDDEEPPDLVAPVAHRVISSELLGSSKSQTGSGGDAPSHENYMEPGSSDTQTKEKPALRRPIASRRRGIVNIPELNKQMLAAGDESHPDSTPTPHSSTASHDTLSKSSTVSKLAHIGSASKGVIMRTLSQHRKMAGNRRAETGLIMSRDELRSTRNRDVTRNPVPQSLKTWELLFNDDDGTDVASTPTPRSMEAVAKGQSSTGSGVIENKRQDEARVKSKDKRSLFSLSPTRWSPRSGMMNHGSEDKESSSRFSEVGESSGVMGRLSSGLRRASQVFGLKSGVEVVNVKSDIVIAGTLDEAVCRICVTCRKKFGYRVYVRDGGRRVKVESGEDCVWNDYLRTTLMIREIKGSGVMCAIVIQPSRKDANKTSIATLSQFYQRLEQELRVDNNKDG